MFLIFPKEEYFQWDTGQSVKLTDDTADVTEVHMYNNRIGGPALVQPIIEGEDGRYIEIPDLLFVKAGRIILWGVISGEHGCCTQTEYDGINVLARPKPTDYAPSKVETLYYKALLERIGEMDATFKEVIEQLPDLNAAVEKANYVLADVDAQLEYVRNAIGHLASFSVDDGGHYVIETAEYDKLQKFDFSLDDGRLCVTY